MIARYIRDILTVRNKIVIVFAYRILTPVTSTLISTFISIFYCDRGNKTNRLSVFASHHNESEAFRWQENDVRCMCEYVGFSPQKLVILSHCKIREATALTGLLTIKEAIRYFLYPWRWEARQNKELLVHLPCQSPTRSWIRRLLSANVLPNSSYDKIFISNSYFEEENISAVP